MRGGIIHSALFGVAIGDALGVPVEFGNRKYLKENPVTDMLAYGTHNQPAGTWSDDSSLTFCLTETLAEKWNTKDEFSGYCGIITKFDLPTDYLQKYEVHNVGGFIHNELWVPSDDLNEFNSNIIGQVEIVKVFIGTNFKFSDTSRSAMLVKEHSIKNK